MYPEPNHKVAITVVILTILIGFGFVFGLKYRPDKQPADSKFPISNIPVIQTVERPVGVNVVEISGCSANPAVTSTTIGGQLVFVNRDSRAHVISFGPDYSFLIPQQSEKLVTLYFAQALGSRKYACDNILGAGTVNINKRR